MSYKVNDKSQIEASSVFSWQGAPSEIADSLKPHRMARTQSQIEPRRLFTINARKAQILRDRFSGAYSKAIPKESNDV